MARKPLQPSRSGQFKRDYKVCKSRGYDMSALQSVMDALIDRKALAPKFKDHTLTGNWRGHRECHIEPDWLLIYWTTQDEITFERTGTHSDLFG